MANMELIETKTAGSGGVANFDFTGLGAYASVYTDLKLLMSLRSNDGTRVTTWVNVQFNNSTSNRTWRDVYGTGSSALSSNDTSMRIGAVNANNSTASTFGNAELYIPNFSSSNYKSSSGDGVSETNATSTNLGLNANLWSDTAAITSIKLIPGDGTAWVEGSTASLYGISAVPSSPKATGGIVSQDATYWYHTFPFSSTFTPTQNITCDYLVIAGGGGGNGDNPGGGGGAGGLRSTVGATGGGGSLESAVALTSSTAYTITIGAGGVSGGIGVQTNGGNSSIAGSGLTTITSTGGGRGGAVSATSSERNGGNGGSGGGAASYSAYGNGTGGTRVTGQGYAGGDASASSGAFVAAGGGGAGAVGQSASGADILANGGNGVQITAFANATFTGFDNGYYAGGGGGGRYPSTTSAGAGGLGGGGNGGTSATASAGKANTGGGGGGGNYSTGAANGGSGLVVLRYAK